MSENNSEALLLPTSDQIGQLRDIAESVAREVGALVAQMRREDVEVAHTKSTQTDVVTRADLAAEQRVETLLKEHRPHDGILGEEGARSVSKTGITWVVDPIDGTVNYLYGRPEYAVSVAAVFGDPEDVATWQPLAGCVYAPALRTCYRAGMGLGAQRDGMDLELSSNTTLDQALVGTGFSYDADTRMEQGKQVAGLIGKVRDIRRAGAGALDVCDVAGGRLDAHLEAGLNPWDVAAAVLVSTEAGAAVRITRPDHRGRRHTLVTAPHLITPLIDAFGPISDPWEQPRHSQR